MVHRLFTTGGFDVEHQTISEGGVAATQKTPGRSNQLHGMLGFIDGVDLFNETINPREKGPPLTSKESIYRRFLMFKEFYAAPAPIVLCEGKTDNVYITHAIRSLAGQYSQLADVNAADKISIKLRRFRYTDTSTGRILGIHGGTGDLGSFIISYRSQITRFKAPGMQSPIILLIDNDSGKNSIFRIVQQITKKRPQDSDPLIHIFANLYLVTTPLIAGTKESTIEDCFDASIKGTVLGRRTFNPASNFNPKIHYGKADFAYKVVQPNAETIDFGGFKPILDRFVIVLAEHAKRFPHAATT